MPTGPRSVAVVGTTGSGATELVRRILDAAGHTDVARLLDSHPSSRRWSTTMTVAGGEFVTTDREGTAVRVQLLDVPCHPELVGRTDTCLEAVDLALICIAAHDGVTAGTQRIWERCVRSGTPRMFVVTHAERRDDADHTVTRITEVFGGGAVSLDLPFGRTTDVHRPEAETPPPEMVTGPVSIGDEYPVVRCSFTGRSGIDAVIEALGDFCPSPLERPRLARHGADTALVVADPDAEVLLTVHSELDELASRDTTGVSSANLVRVVSGGVRRGDVLMTADSPRPSLHTVTAVGRLHGTVFAAAHTLTAGEVGLVVVDPCVTSGTTLGAQGDIIPAVAFPPPASPWCEHRIRVSVPAPIPLDELLAACVRADPTITIRPGPRPDEFTTLSQGPVHLECVLGRLEREHGARFDIAEPDDLDPGGGATLIADVPVETAPMARRGVEEIGGRIRSEAVVREGVHRFEIRADARTLNRIGTVIAEGTTGRAALQRPDA
jgi:translation elongation factor EF-G